MALCRAEGCARPATQVKICACGAVVGYCDSNSDPDVYHDMAAVLRHRTDECPERERLCYASLCLGLAVVIYAVDGRRFRVCTHCATSNYNGAVRRGKRPSCEPLCGKA